MLSMGDEGFILGQIMGMQSECVDLYILYGGYVKQDRGLDSYY